MKVLVTGASGFVGRNLLAALDADWDVTALFRQATDFPAVAAAFGDHVHPFRCDLSETGDVAALARATGGRFDIVFHLAGRVAIPASLADPVTDLRDNAVTTVNLAQRVESGHLVYLSSGAVYEGHTGRAHTRLPLAPSLPYAAHKLLGEFYARAACERFGTAGRVTLVRFFGAYGMHEPRHKLYARLVQRFAVERQADIEVYGDGANLIDAMWVADASVALRRIALDGRPDRPAVWTVDLAGGRPLAIDDLVRLAGRVLLDGDVTIRHSAAAPERNQFFGDPAPLEAALGVHATTPLEEGFRRYAEWWRGRTGAP